MSPPRLLTRTSLPRRLPSLCAPLLPVLLLAASPARAELRVRVSRPTTGRFESVRITVTDPIGGIDARPGPLAVMLADSADQRQPVLLEPTGRPGEWSGRFTPVKTGRYTGTAMLERGAEKELGLVPLIMVRKSNRPGFVRLHPRSGRALQYSLGKTLFPIGVRLDARDLRSGVNWRTELARLRARGVNYLEIPVEWPGAQSEPERRESQRVVDAFLLNAEQSGRLVVQLRLQGPANASGPGAALYEEQLQRWVRRWSYSPALAAWYVAGAGEGVTPELRSRFVKAVRAVDSYHHLVVAPGYGQVDASSSGADLSVARLSWERPSGVRALVEVPDAPALSAAPLAAPTAAPPGALTLAAPVSAFPGESSWQFLATGGIGLPLWSYRPGTADAELLLQRLGRLAEAARSIPYHVPGAALTGVLAVDAPGTFYRYGPVSVGWMVVDAGRAVDIPSLPRGRYRARFWDPGNDVPVGDSVLWSEGQSARITVPPGLRAVFLSVAPVSPTPAPAARAAARRSKRASTASAHKIVHKTARQRLAERRKARYGKARYGKARGEGTSRSSRRRGKAAASPRKARSARATTGRSGRSRASGKARLATKKKRRQ